MTPRCGPGCPARPWSWTPSTPSSSPRTASTPLRRRVQNQTLGHRGRNGDPLYRIRRTLLRGAEKHTTTSYTRLMDGLAAGDPDQHVAHA